MRRTILSKKIAFSGCRHIGVDEGPIEWALDAINEVWDAYHIKEVIVGDCPSGVDQSVRTYIPMMDDSIYQADWENTEKQPDLSATKP